MNFKKNEFVFQKKKDKKINEYLKEFI